MATTQGKRGAQRLLRSRRSGIRMLARQIVARYGPRVDTIEDVEGRNIMREMWEAAANLACLPESGLEATLTLAIDDIWAYIASAHSGDRPPDLELFELYRLAWMEDSDESEECDE